MIHPYLQTFVEIVTNVNPSEGYFIVDADFVVLAADETFLINWGDPDIVGKRMRDSNSTHQKLFVESHKYVLQFVASAAKSTKKVILFRRDDLIEFYDVTLSKIIEPNSLELLGLAFFTNRLWLDVGLVNILSQSSSQVYGFYPDRLPYANLTPLEQEIIWLLVSGKSQKEIAFILSELDNREIDRNRVASLINRSIYPKFAVNDLSGLIEKIGKTDLMASISSRLFDYFRQKKK